ncbi:glycogen/starch/alpha-glucan phosphorylase [Enterovibrio paralichthyis]|uniref:glycogen/starch/alpha-glucan phosphorylase n=1 Tax=Enterovibrio paralichthyis TaxID=2853805 RepID=UPI001C47A468|nr:glycogen/starch/alpha-glucan phosphorylase [Enterovibrio paralichthyis]MBV7299170.1 glycogen/starch/alpha-glucan phosphorylase [Enterovibrio paralichthyis]
MRTQTQAAVFDKEEFKKSVLAHLTNTYAQLPENATTRGWYLAMAKALSDMNIGNLAETEAALSKKNAKKVNYLSMEFLIGRMTGNNLIALDIYPEVTEVMAEFGLNLTDLLEEERDPALGNGGLGRLAACFMDSLVAQEFPAVGYGLHYEYGLFRQSFENGEQKEAPDAWKGMEGYPCEVARPELTQKVGFWGSVETYLDEEGNTLRRWQPALQVEGRAWDIPVVGYKNNSTYPLRLWECHAPAPFDLARFNDGDYVNAQFSELEAANLTKVLYPNDNHEQGKVLRLMQQYFHCACSVADILRRHLSLGRSLESLSEFETIQLNDTHPTIAIPELMRVLMDDHGFSWDKAWHICSHTFAYTNHTLLPEALETWSAELMGRLLPRHMEIIFQINAQMLTEVKAKWPGDAEKLRKLSLIQEGEQQMVRMANLCVASSYAVNGVAALHSDLVKRDLFPEFNALYPNRLLNVTNGITPRRWLKFCNPALSSLINQHVEGDWAKDLDLLGSLNKLAGNKKFQKQFMAVKKQNKQRLADWVSANMGITLNTDAIFDVQIKRLHEYKRQHLNLLHILSLYQRLLNEPGFDIHPRVFIFAAKAAPGYALAKDIIFAINRAAETINNDSRIGDKLKVVFIPDYRVSLAEIIIPAADVSEQISTAGKEASGTGNMKMALNGALTIGTMDGANVEIREEVGDDNIFIFGMEVEQVMEALANGYHPAEIYHRDPVIKNTIDMLYGDALTPDAPGRLASIADNLVHSDPYLVLADFADYARAHADIDRAYRDQSHWAEMAIINAASVGKFSSDRSIRDYVDTIWQLEAINL